MRCHIDLFFTDVTKSLRPSMIVIAPTVSAGTKAGKSVVSRLLIWLLFVFVVVFSCSTNAIDCCFVGLSCSSWWFRNNRLYGWKRTSVFRRLAAQGHWRFETWRIVQWRKEIRIWSECRQIVLLCVAAIDFFFLKISFSGLGRYRCQCCQSVSLSSSSFQSILCASFVFAVVDQSIAWRHSKRCLSKWMQWTWNL